jgi:hypothetical protein
LESVLFVLFVSLLAGLLDSLLDSLLPPEALASPFALRVFCPEGDLWSVA